MPIEVGVWRLGTKPQKINMTSIDSELMLEDALAKDLSILSSQLMLIGRQVATAYGKFIDMLAMDVSGNLSIIELKKNRTPREVVAQLKWYSQTLKLLFPGSRVFVNIPKTGYVGVGTVKEPAVPAKDFTFSEDQKEGNVIVGTFDIPILHAPLQAPKMGENADDPDLCEYLVRVVWIKTVPRNEAYWEKGLFALQNTACRLTSSFTIEKLSQHFGLDD